jgi:membrane protein YdbS with pleckstrin-like domain
MGITKNKLSRRTIALFWLLLVAFVIGIILYLEQIAILYILATLALVVLLLIVAFADLEKVGRENLEGFAPKE